jgi:hypothetical protein
MDLLTVVMAQEQEGEMEVLEETTVLVVVVVVASVSMRVLAELKLLLGDKAEMGDSVAAVVVEAVVGEVGIHVFPRAAVVAAGIPAAEGEVLVSAAAEVVVVVVVAGVTLLILPRQMLQVSLEAGQALLIMVKLLLLQSLELQAVLAHWCLLQ